MHSTQLGPDPADLDNVCAITGLSAAQATLLLKKHNGNMENAINAYFDGSAFQENNWVNLDDSLLSINLPNDDTGSERSFGHGARSLAPSRPPSRMSTKSTRNVIDLSPEHAAAEARQNMSAADREEYDMRQAMALSLGQDFDEQETGVTTSTGFTEFKPSSAKVTSAADYDMSNWALVPTNPSLTTKEVVMDPTPEKRKRIPGEPAFIRPLDQTGYLSSLITILHSIPMSREALLLREMNINNYGFDKKWWSGAQIETTKVSTGTITDFSTEADLIHECQRLMAFLDKSTRAYAAVDSVAKFSNFDNSQIGAFLELWQRAATRNSPDNPLAALFSSTAEKIPVKEDGSMILEDAAAEELMCVAVPVPVVHGQNLYDVLDRIIWESDLPDRPLDEVYIKELADIFTIQLSAQDRGAKSLDVKIPAVWYADRYMEHTKEEIKKLRERRIGAEKKIDDLSEMEERYRWAPNPKGGPRIDVRESLLESARFAEVVAEGMTSAVKSETGGDGEVDVERPANLSVQEKMKLAADVRKVVEDIDRRLERIQKLKRDIQDEVEKSTNLYTSPSAEDETKLPRVRYTLRGVSTTPHITYVLRKNDTSTSELTDSTETTSEESKPDYHWWRISFSADDAKGRVAGASLDKSRDTNEPFILQSPFVMSSVAKSEGDAMGYTITAVREVEVLKAAREESSSVMLVYASERAVRWESGEVSGGLKTFVERDNETFAAELEDEAMAMTDVGEPGPDIPTITATEPTDTDHKPAPEMMQIDPLQEQDEDAVDVATAQTTHGSSRGGYDDHIPTSLAYPSPEMEERSGNGAVSFLGAGTASGRAMRDRKGDMDVDTIEIDGDEDEDEDEDEEMKGESEHREFA